MEVARNAISYDDPGFAFILLDITSMFDNWILVKNAQIKDLKRRKPVHVKTNLHNGLNIMLVLI